MKNNTQQTKTEKLSEKELKEIIGGDWIFTGNIGTDLVVNGLIWYYSK